VSDVSSKKGKIAFIVYLFLLSCIVAFGVLYFVPFGGGQAWTMIVVLCAVYSFAAAGAYFGSTVWRKIGYTLLFGAIFGGFFLCAYDTYTLSTKKIDLLIEQMHDPDENVRCRAMNALRKEPISSSTVRPRVVEALIEALGDEKYSCRSCAANALGEIGDPMAVEPLIAALEDDNTSMVPTYAIVEALGEIGDERAIPVLVSHLLEYRSKYSPSGEVADALEQIGWQPESEEEKVRFYVAKEDAGALLGIWDQTKRVLLKDLETNSTSCVEYAICVFVSLGNEEIIPVLIDNLNKSDSKDVAEIYLNCGHDGLEHAAEEWATAHGYIISHSPGSPDAVWGSW
jgi:hypothetical protein